MINIQQNIPLAPYTTFKIGGPARFFVEVDDEETLIEALNYARENKLAVFVLGGGSNVLISDQGFNGLVIKFKVQSSKLKITDKKLNLVECWAGENLARVVRFCVENSLTGLEWAAGIPGSIGGAVRGNAGSPRGCMGDIVESVRALDISDLKFSIFELNACHFSYRDSVFKEKGNLIILSVTLKLNMGNKEEIEKMTREVIEKRNKSNYPNPKEPSSGSFFKNPVVTNKKLIAEFEKETGLKVKDNEVLYQSSTSEVKIPAGWLIDQAGFRGKKIGGVQVSEKHANFIVNRGNSKAEDVIILSSLIKQKVRREFDVQLQEEVQLVGF